MRARTLLDTLTNKILQEETTQSLTEAEIRRGAAIIVAAFLNPSKSKADSLANW
jgi:hypothetical protein